MRPRQLVQGMRRAAWLVPVALLASVTALAMETAGSVRPAPLPAQDQAQAQGSPIASPCLLRTEKHAAPARVQLGHRTRVTLEARPECPERTVPLEVVLVIDNSGSMAADGKLTLAKRAARTFLERTDLRRTRIGIVSFNTTARVEAQLTADADALGRAVDGIGPLGSTNIVDALDTAGQVLRDGRADRPWPPDTAPVEVVVLLSDGRHTAGGGEPGDDGRGVARDAALRLRTSGAILSTICLGMDCDRLLMRLSASSRSLYFDSPTAIELVDIYARIAERLRQPTVSSVRVVDVVPDNMRLLLGSAEPVPDEVRGQELVWRLEAVPPEGFTISYFVRPLELGLWPTNVRAVAEFSDIFERVGSALFPVPEVQVSHLSYLPLALRERCDPTHRHVDVVLLIDVSSSMELPARAGEISKREAAARAATAFVDQMRLRGPGMGGGATDRVAVLSFDADVRPLIGLSDDRAAVRAALGRLPRGEGTRIDRGLVAAAELMAGVPSVTGRTRAVVLLTDGRPSVDDATVLDAAARVRREGTAIFAVGLGADVNPALLRGVAGDGSRYQGAADAASLEAIYRNLAIRVPCPGGRHDWGRPWP